MIFKVTYVTPLVTFIEADTKEEAEEALLDDLPSDSDTIVMERSDVAPDGGATADTRIIRTEEATPQEIAERERDDDDDGDDDGDDDE